MPPVAMCLYLLQERYNQINLIRFVVLKRPGFQVQKYGTPKNKVCVDGAWNLFHVMEYSVGISFAIIAKHTQPTALHNELHRSI